MANTWDELPIEMMGERPDTSYFKKVRRNESDSKDSAASPAKESDF
jgi:hypothetical protein